MCGILGLTIEDPAKLKVMHAQLVHRGTDGEGALVLDGVSLGHARLSIIDCEARSNQPMISHDGNSVITFNGEIYNYQELREELVAEGTTFATQSDTEVILEGYSRYGAAFFSKLRGMWAFAIHDKVRKQLVLSRDQFGIKPLYYAIESGTLYIASEIRALKSVLNTISPNTDAYYQYFSFGFFLFENTYIKEIKKLPPGEILVWDIEKKECVSSTQIVVSEEKKVVHTYEDTIEKLKKTLKESVQAHFISDVPVSMLLSGGTDSSLIAAMAKDLGKNFTCYTLGVKGSIDTAYAKKIAEALHLDVQYVEMKESDLADQYEKIWNTIDEPTADVSIIPTTLIYSKIAGKAKVVLSGEGGDELFGGYERHQVFSGITSFTDALPLHWLQSLYGVSTVALRYWNPLISRVQNVLGKKYGGMISAYEKHMRIAGIPIAAKKIRKDLENMSANAGNIQPNLYFDRNVYLPQDLLYKNDNSSMAATIEARVPFVDAKVSAWVDTHVLPEYQLSKAYAKKRVLKDVLATYLPKELVFRPKSGFGFSLRVYNAKQFLLDTTAAMEYHYEHAAQYGIDKKMKRFIHKKNAELLLQKYPRFCFALVSNWKMWQTMK